MINTLKSELRKILTARSTYYLGGFIVVLLLLFSFYVQGWRLTPQDLANSNLISQNIINAIGFVGLIGAFVGVLLVTHEYRYNTITYTLTTTSRRIHVLLAKAIVISVFAVALSACVALLSALFVYVGVALHGNSLTHQDLHLFDVVWRVLAIGWAYSMYGMLFALLIRNQVGTIVTFLILPGPLESIAGLLLKSKQVYLPFTALNNLAGTGGMFTMKPGKAAIVVLVYVVVGLIISGILFVRRDAN